MSGILTRKYSVFPVQPRIIRNEGEQIVIPSDAVIDSGRRQNWEVQHSVTMDSMYNKLTTGTWHDVNDKPW